MSGKMPDLGKKIQCFIIMPISKTKEPHTEEYWTNHYNFLKNRIEEIPNLEVHRSEALRGDILRDIIKNLITSEIVLADLTDLNPNVYWELGVRQSFKHRTITIAEIRKKIAFDMGMKSILRYYPKDSLKNEEFVKKLKKAILHCIENPDAPDSHVLETISGRGTLYQIIHRDEITRRIGALISEAEYNISTISKCRNTINENVGKEFKDKKILPRRFHTTAVELLVATRYLDKKTEFYILTENYLEALHQINSQLPRWPTASGYEPFEKWFLKNFEVYNTALQMFADEIKDIKEKIPDF